jgi:hypothetical protein
MGHKRPRRRSGEHRFGRRRCQAAVGTLDASHAGAGISRRGVNHPPRRSGGSRQGRLPWPRPRVANVPRASRPPLHFVWTYAIVPGSVAIMAAGIHRRRGSARQGDLPMRPRPVAFTWSLDADVVLNFSIWLLCNGELTESGVLDQIRRWAGREPFERYRDAQAIRDGRSTRPSAKRGTIAKASGSSTACAPRSRETGALITSRWRRSGSGCRCTG